MVFAVLLHCGTSKGEGHEKENESNDLEPQLVSGASERAGRGADPRYDRVEGAVAPGPAPGDLSYDPQLSEGRNFAHGLDFNSLWRYNDATRGIGERRTVSATDGIQRYVGS